MPCALRRAGRALGTAPPGASAHRAVGHHAAASPSCELDDLLVRRSRNPGVARVSQADDAPAVEHDDPVGLEDGADPLRDDDHGRCHGSGRALPRGGARRWRRRGPRSSRRRGRSRGRLTSARAMARRWRWPPDTFVPPWSTGASSPPGMAATKSRAWATSSAVQRSSSVASRPANRRLSATVPLNRYACCGTSPMSSQRLSSERSRTSTPSIRTAPALASKNRGMSCSSVVFPAPVPPMMAVVSPGCSVKDRSREHRLLAAGVAEGHVAKLDDPLPVCRHNRT